METEKIEIVYMDVQDKSSKVMFKSISEELTITCDNLEIRKCDDLGEFNPKGDLMDVKENYRAFFNEAHKTMNKLYKLLDVNLKECWDIFYKYSDFCCMDSWEPWQNVETFEDLNLNVKYYDENKEHLNKMIEKMKSQDSHIDIGR